MQRALKVIGGAVVGAASIYGGYVAITYVLAELRPALDNVAPVA